MKASANLLALAVGLPFAAAKVSYDGYRAFSIESHHRYEAVKEALEGLEYVSLSCGENHDSIDVAVAPEDIEAFEALGLDATIVTEDLGAALEEEAVTGYTRTVKRQEGSSELPDFAWFDAYHPFESHLDFLEDVAAVLPDNSEIFTAGESLEGRPLQGIHVWGRDGPGQHEAVVWHGTVHAREWIVAPTVEFMLYKLVESYQNASGSAAHPIDNYDFYITPVVNPDGFVWTHEEDRMWRKNRQHRNASSCVGTDNNRNWPYQWDVPGGSSTDPCSQTYRGEEAGDTPEIQALSAHVLGLSEEAGVKLFVDWHSFSQLILLPYGYSCDVVADDNEHQVELAAGVEAAIRSVNGLEFVYGPTCPTIYQTSGVSMDWGLDVAGVELSWGFELRPASQGQGGFVLPPEQIIPSGEEQWAGMEWLLANM